jgi:hypothetical protein
MEKLPTIEDAGIIAVGLSEHLEPKQQAFFIAGFQECIKYLMSNQPINRTQKDAIEPCTLACVAPSKNCCDFEQPGCQWPR